MYEEEHFASSPSRRRRLLRWNGSDDESTLISLSPEDGSADSGIGVDIDGGTAEPPPAAGASDNEDSLSCDCVCSCCCKCREQEGGGGGDTPVSVTSPVITFLSQQYTRLPSLQPPTPPIEALRPNIPTKPTNASPHLRSRSTSRLEDVVLMAAVKRHDDNTMAAIVRRRRRLKLRAKSGDFQSLQLVVPSETTATGHRQADHHHHPEDNGGGTVTSIPPNSGGGVGTLEIKFVW